MKTVWWQMSSWKLMREETSLKVYNLNEITDSRVLYDKTPPRFMIYMIFIVTALIVAFLVWSDKSIKTYVVKGQGIVTTENKANIMASMSGVIKEVNVEEGKEVKAGDVLFALNPTDPNLQLDQVNGQIDYENKRIAYLVRAEKDATKGANSFDQKNADEVEFYNRLSGSYARKKEYAIDEAALKTQGYTDDQIKQYKDQQKIKLNELYYDTITGLTSEKNQLKTDKNKLEAQRLALTKSLEEFKIVAPQDGKMHLNTSITKGMVLQAGNLLGSISSNKDGLVIQTMLSSSDRPRIHVGDEVALAVAGLNQSEYGTIKGKVISIDEDATIDNEKGHVYFNVKVKPEKTYLQDKKGEKVNLTLGMVTETRVKYEKITYMKYFLEQIGVKFD